MNLLVTLVFALCTKTEDGLKEEYKSVCKHFNTGLYNFLSRDLNAMIDDGRREIERNKYGREGVCNVYLRSHSVTHIG
jgi:hypothetical protein